MSDRKLLTKLNQLKPKRPEDLTDDFKLKRLGSGAFREVFELKGHNAVIKFPRDSEFSSDSNMRHAKEEIRVLRMIHTKLKYKVLRSVVPELIYSDMRNGVIVVRKYSNVPRTVARGAAKAISQVFKVFFPRAADSEYDDSDIEPYNIMGEYKTVECWDGKKRKHFTKVILIDLGLV